MDSDIEGRVRAFWEQAFNGRNLDLIDAITAPQFVNRNALPGTPPGPEGHRQVVQRIWSAVPDARFQIEHLARDGDTVICVGTLSGSHEGTLLGVPATGEKVEWRQCHLYRFDESGRAVQHDAIRDDVSLLRRLSAGATSPRGGGATRRSRPRPTMRAAADGRLLEDGAPGYDEARTVWNAMVQRRPRAIVRCANADDVAEAIRLGRERDLEIGVRCGGHSVLGLCVPDDGLMIDLRPMGGVRVDPLRRRAWVQGGALLGALDRAAMKHGMTTTAGNVSHTGVGGLTLGGGMGWLARRLGLSCDNVQAYELITADGQRRHVDEAGHPDLFWALRGGGGNFGVVSEFEFRLHPVARQAHVVELFFALDDAPAALRGWRDLNATAPRAATFTAWVGESQSPVLPSRWRGRPVAAIGFVWAGEPELDRRLLPALRALGRPVAERIEALPYLELQRMDDTHEGHALRRYWKGHYLRSLPDAAIEAFLLRGTSDGSGEHLPDASLQAYGGAIAEVPDADSAFSQRDALFEFVASARWSDGAEDEQRMSAARRYGASLEPFASGMYVNAMSDEGATGVARAYPPAKLARLSTLKSVYDPDNVFRRNQNFPPRTRR
ncbi:MAG: FAD-binding protein [Solirubrobacteraceae bacterium]|nr:FAD-binding protein [Solirubrobacteraceae bacterium]